MAYAFDKVRLLGYNHVPIFFENGTRYKIRKNLKIQGTFYEPLNQSGVKATWTDAAALLAGAQDYDDIILNNVYFGIGKITNISFDEGNHVTRQNYTFDIECYEAIDLNSSMLDSMEYCPPFASDGGGTSSQIAALLDKLEETLSYEIDAEGNQTYTQTATVRFNQKANDVDGYDESIKPVLSTGGLSGAMTQAAALIDLLFGSAVTALNSLGGIATSFDRLTTIASTLVTKSYNLVDGQLSFTRKTTIPSDDNTAYSISYSYDIEADANNVSNVTEKASIKGLTSYPYPEAASQVQVTANSALVRCNAILQAYSQKFGNNPLAPNPIQKSVTSDVFRGVFEISNTFTNDPRYVNPAENPLPEEAVSYVSSTQIDLNEDGVTEITEQGTITGLGPARPPGGQSGRYKAAIDFYNNTVKTQVDSRVTATKGTNKPTIMKRSLTLSELDGIVQYSVTASDLSDYTDGDLMSLGFRKTSVEATVSMPVHLTQTFNVVNYKQIIQPQNQATVGTVSMSVKLKGNRTMTSADGYLSQATSLASTFITANDKISAVIGQGKQWYIKNASYTFTPNTNDFVLNINWNFFLQKSDYPTFGDLTLAK